VTGAARARFAEAAVLAAAAAMLLLTIVAPPVSLPDHAADTILGIDALHRLAQAV
jgi:hypothetical protein